MQNRKGTKKEKNPSNPKFGGGHDDIESLLKLMQSCTLPLEGSPQFTRVSTTGEDRTDDETATVASPLKPWEPVNPPKLGCQSRLAVIQAQNSTMQGIPFNQESNFMLVKLYFWPQCELAFVNNASPVT